MSDQNDNDIPPRNEFLLDEIAATLLRIENTLDRIANAVAPTSLESEFGTSGEVQYGTHIDSLPKEQPPDPIKNAPSTKDSQEQIRSAVKSYGDY